MRLKNLFTKIGNQKGFDPKEIESYFDNLTQDLLQRSDTLQSAFEVTDDEMECLYAYAYTLYQKNNFTESADTFRWLTLLNPFRLKYWMGLGSTLQCLKLFEKALHCYAVASLLDTESKAPHRHAYECYMALGNREEANKALALTKR